MIDIRTYGAVPDGATDCSSAINAALLVDDVIIKNGAFAISSSIKIPSNRTVYGQCAKLKLIDSSFDNHFRNSDFVNGNVNINIIGLGGFSIDGNTAKNNSSDYSAYGGEDSDTMYKASRICFCNVSGFEVKNITTNDRACYFSNLQNCSTGSIHDIFSSIRERTQNQDLICIRHNCNNIDIYNIAGYSFDDWLSFNVGNAVDLSVKITNWQTGDAHDIECWNFNSWGRYDGSICAVIAGDGNKVYNINSHDHTLRLGCVYFNFYGAYYTTPPIASDITNITMDNVVVNFNNRDYLFYFGEDCSDLLFTNIVNNTVKGLYTITGGDPSDNVKINGSQVTA